jgi:hypothetical protein
MSYLPSKPQSVFSTVNFTTTPLGIGATYTGTYESTDYPDILVTCVANVDLDYYIDLSSDGITADVSVPYSVRGGGINYPHRLTTGPRYVRLRIENNSGVGAAFTTGNIQHGQFNDLAIGQHRIAAQDNDATIVRPTDFRIETARGLRDQTASINLWGINRDVDVATSEEVLASFGTGPINLTTDVMPTADTFDVTYTNTLDGSTATGARTLQIEYIDANYELQTAIHVMGSTGTDTTAFSGFGINRVFCVASGGGFANGGDITLTPSTIVGATAQSSVPAGASVSQGLIFHTPINHTLCIDGFHVNAIKLGGGGAPKVTFRIYSYSRVTSMAYLLDEERMDTGILNTADFTFENPIVLGGKEILFVSVETDLDNAEVSGRILGTLHKN